MLALCDDNVSNLICLAFFLTSKILKLASSKITFDAVGINLFSRPIVAANAIISLPFFTTKFEFNFIGLFPKIKTSSLEYSVENSFDFKFEYTLHGTPAYSKTKLVKSIALLNVFTLFFHKKASSFNFKLRS